MDKALRDYIQHIEAKLKKWHDIPVAERRQLYNDHLVKVRDFQHERLIHLLITLFFGFLFLFSLCAIFTMQVLGLKDVGLLGMLLAAILLVVELFYIRYYYALENGVQHLYTITDSLTI